MKVTIKSIAKHFGTSTTTISRAINDSGYVRDDLRKSILKYAKDHNWHVSSAAQSLRNGKTKTVAIIINGIASYHNRIIIEEVLKISQQVGYHVFISQCSTGKEQAAEAESYLNRKPEVVIVVPLAYPSIETKKILKQLQEQGSMVIAVGRDSSDSYVTFGYNYEELGYLAMKYLFENGHNKIMFLGQFADQEHLKENLINSEGVCGGIIIKGIEVAAMELSFEFDRFNDVISDSYRKYPHIIKLIKEKSHTAFICENVHLLKDFYHLCRENNISIPDDISVIGIGYDPSYRALTPAPVCINGNVDKMAKAIADSIVSQKQDCYSRMLTQPESINGNSVKNMNFNIQ